MFTFDDSERKLICSLVKSHPTMIRHNSSPSIKWSLPPRVRQGWAGPRGGVRVVTGQWWLSHKRICCEHAPTSVMAMHLSCIVHVPYGSKRLTIKHAELSGAGHAGVPDGGGGDISSAWRGRQQRPLIAYDVYLFSVSSGDGDDDRCGDDVDRVTNCMTTLRYSTRQ